MTWVLVAGVLMLAVLVGGWLYYAWRQQHPPKPKPTPWADSTKVAQKVREIEARDDAQR